MTQEQLQTTYSDKQFVLDNLMCIVGPNNLTFTQCTPAAFNPVGLDDIAMYFCVPQEGEKPFLLSAEFCQQNYISDAEIAHALCRPVPFTLMTLSQALGMNIHAAEQELPMYILTNPEKHYGAGVIFHPNVAQAVFNHFKEPVYCIPSSIHEWLLIPKSKAADYDIEYLYNMVCEVNSTVVEKKDFLADHLYLMTEMGDHVQFETIM